MNKIRLLVDSTSSYLPKDFQGLNVELVPTTFIVDGKEYNPLESPFELNEYYELIKTAQVGSACVNQYVFEDIFKRVLDAGEDIVFICLSSGLSSSYNNACTAREVLKEQYGDRIAIVDPLTASTGMAFFVRETLKMIEEGKTIQEIEKALDKNAINVGSYFTIGSLDHLYKGGRLNKATAVVGNIMKMKPIVHCNEEGKLKIYEIHLGKRKTIMEMGKIAIEKADPNYPIEIAYTNNESEMEFLKAKLFEANPNFVINTIIIDYTLGVHCGPETIAMFFKNK